MATTMRRSTPPTTHAVVTPPHAHAHPHKHTCVGTSTSTSTSTAPASNSNPASLASSSSTNPPRSSGKPSPTSPRRSGSISTAYSLIQPAAAAGRASSPALPTAAAAAVADKPTTPAAASTLAINNSSNLATATSSNSAIATSSNLATATSSNLATATTSPRHGTVSTAYALPAHSSAQTSAPVSLPAPARQLRPPKSPLYVPAVLRPNDRPAWRGNARPSSAAPGALPPNNTPPTPSHSIHSSLDSLPGTMPALGLWQSLSPGKASQADASALHRANTVPDFRTTDLVSPIALATAVAAAASTSRSSSSSSLTSVISPALSSPSSFGFGGHDANITRAHWKPDAQAASCDAPGCMTIFTLLARRHHCRRCGGVFCSSHARRQVPLDRQAVLIDPRPHPVSQPQPPRELSEADLAVERPEQLMEEAGLEMPVASNPAAESPFGWARACEACFAQWACMLVDNDSRTLPRASTAPVVSAIPESDPVADSRATSDSPETLPDMNPGGSVAASAPRDWHWSTF